MGYRSNLLSVIDEASISTVLVDMDKTLTSNGHPYPGVPEVMEEIISSGVKVFIVSNSSSTSETISSKLNKIGLENSRHFTDIFTSGDVLRSFFSSSLLEGKKILSIFNILDDKIFIGAKAEVYNTGFDIDSLKEKLNKINPDYIYVGAPYKDRVSATSLSDIEVVFKDYIDILSLANKPLLAGHNDRNFFEYGRYITLQGDILAVIKEKNPNIVIKTFGKPSLDIFRLLSKKYPEAQYSKETMMMVGDNPETDLLFARRVGIKYTHVLTSKGLSGLKANYVIPLVSGREEEAFNYQTLFNTLKINSFCHN